MNCLSSWVGRSVLNRLTAIGMGVSVGLLLLLGMIAFPLFHRQAQSNIEAHYRNNLDRAEDQLRFRASALLESLDELAANSFVVNAFVDSTGRELYLMPTLRDYRPPFGVVQTLDLFDSNLSVFGHSGPPWPVTTAERAVVLAALHKGRTQLVFEPVDGQSRMLIAVPVYYPPAASHEGVLLSRVDATKLFGPATSFLQPSECLGVSAGVQPLLSTPCDAAALGQRVFMQSTLTDNADGDVQIRIGFGDDKETALQSLSFIAAVYAGGSMLALTLVFLATRFVGRPFAAKLEELAHAANALAEDPNATARAKWEHPDEIGRLTQAFDTLVEKWRDIQSSLERRVEQRTEQLAGALQQAQESNRTKSEFLAVMSHEIRTPMNGVVGMIQALETTQLNEMQRRQLQVVRGSSDLLLRIIDDLLDFSRIDAGKLALNVAPFIVGRALQDLLAALMPAAVANGIELRLHPMPVELSRRVNGDEIRLRQVLTNLVHNAIKFTARGGRVDVATAAEIHGNKLRVDFIVSDTGIGIDASKLERIFDPFEQADRSTTRRFGGTGLGLAIVKRLVDLMEGDVDVESEPGRGSRFKVRLALSVTPEDVGHEHLQRNSGSSFEHLRVLVAEDNPVNQLVAMAQLQSLGIDKVTIADDGQQAVAAAMDGAFDLILMDIQMPVMDGYEAAAVLRRAGVTVPIVAMTANVMASDRQAYATAGMIDCLAKPMDLDRLREIVEHCAVATSAERVD
jgi:signal transduction histidine kinase/ActR/RegA family two-component response regulator